LWPIFSTGQALPNARWLVDGYTKHEIGGCKTMTMRATGGKDDLPQMQLLVNLLNTAVTVVNERHDPRWWGYVHEILISYAGVSFGVSLDGMANRVAVGYTDYAGRRATTAWAENTASRGGYGVKELRVPLSDANENAAIYRRDSELFLRAVPQGVTSFDRGASDNSVTVTFHCRGWWERLDWIYWLYFGGVYENATGNSELQFGGGNSVDRLSQLLEASEMTDPIEFLALPLRRYGIPIDGLVAEIRTGGTPGTGTLVSTANFISSNISNVRIGELQASLSPAWTPDGTQHHLELYRGGPNDATNYYAVGVDTARTGGFAPAQARTATVWITGNPDGAMQFRLTGDISTTTQIQRIATGFVNTGILSGVVIEQTSDAETIPYRNGDATCRNEIENLLAKSIRGGARLLADIRPDRTMRVYAESTAPTYYITPGPRLQMINGAPIDLSICPAGVLARLRDVFPVIERSVNYARAVEVPIAEGEYSVEYDAASEPVGEAYRFVPRGAPDPFADPIVAHP
jgi:hypothetical protein